jgi:signal transduction histidine kinase
MLFMMALAGAVRSDSMRLPSVDRLTAATHRLSPALSVLADPTQRFSAPELLRRGSDIESYGFTPRVLSVREGYVPGWVWVRFRINRAPDAPESWWLHLSNPLTDEIELHLRHADGSVQALQAGQEWPRAQLLRDSIKPAIPLHLQPGQTELLLRLHSSNSMSSQITVLSTDAFQSSEHWWFVEGGIFTGAHLLAILIAVLMWVSTREEIWRQFTAFTVLNAFVVLYQHGIIDWLGLRNSVGLGDVVNAVALSILVWLSTLFIGNLLDAPRNSPRGFRALLLLLGTVMLVSSLLALFGWPRQSVSITTHVGVVSVSLMIYGVARQVARRAAFSGYVLVSAGVYLVACEIRFFRSLGYLPSAWWTEELHAWLTLAYLSLLGIGAAMRSRLIAQERDRLGGELVAERRARRSDADFLSMLSHELRTPLATIEATVRVLREVTTLDEPSRRQRFDKIERSAERVRALLDQHLVSRRNDEISQPPALQPLELGAFIRTTVSADRAELPESRFRVMLPEAEAFAMADPALLRIVLDNLIGNARKYGGPSSRIQILLDVEADVCRISVHDSGPAVPAQDRPSLFGKYVRGRNAGTHPGMGLGLFVVERIAQMHGGRVGLECPPHGGNRFWISLPRLS